MARFSRLVRGAGAALALGAGAPFLAACLLGDLDGLTGGGASEAGPPPVDATSSAADANADVTAAADASATPADAGADAAPSVTLLQSLGSTGAASVSFSRPTSAGSLLIAMRPDSAPPGGAGWRAASISSNRVDAIFFWPNAPADLQTFTIPSGGNADVILLELAGLPAALTTAVERDTGGKGASVGAITVNADTAMPTGFPLFLFLDSNEAPSATTPGWMSLGTDHNNNFAWWRISTGTAPTTTVTLGATTPAALLLVGLGGT